MTSKTHHADSDDALHSGDAEMLDTSKLSSSHPERIASLEDELAQMRDRWMRSEAEVANIRTRAKREVEEARIYAVQKFATDIVEAAENLRRAMGSLPPLLEGEPQIIEGLRLGLIEIERSFIAILERNGVNRHDPTGAVFDPNLHQAVAEHEAAESEPGTVLQALTPAWTLNGRLLRPATVVVAKGPTTKL